MNKSKNRPTENKIIVNGAERKLLPNNSTLINRYRIKGLLGYGGMGAVYKGYDKHLKGLVAIKENFLQTRESIQQFEKEASLLFQLKNDHLPRVIDRFTAEDRQYLVMDFIDGDNLWNLIHQDNIKPPLPLEEKRALKTIIQICDAVIYLHQQNPPIIHRDIKPQNIKINTEGVAVLVDFGIAKVGGAESQTHRGARGMTPGYAPPEQYMPQTSTKQSSDIYALGATLYAILTAQKPPDSLKRMLGEVEFKSPQLLNSNVSMQAAKAITYAMQVKPGDRPPSVAAWQQQLKEILNSPETPSGVPSNSSPIESEEFQKMPETDAPTGQDLFISYRRVDIDFVTHLHRELTNRGISAWFDKKSIEVADHWRTSIAEGIRGCKIFLLVLSPDAVQSVNIRKEVDLAETHHKIIIPLVWRKTEIPVAFEYALAGIQWIEFDESASLKNYDDLASIINAHLGKAPPATVQEPKSDREERGRRGRGRGKAKTVSAVATGITVITKVVIQITSFTSTEQDAINQELKWLFNAADHFLQVQRGQTDRNSPVPVEIPADAKVERQANNTILSGLDDFSLQLIDSQIEGIIKRIDIYVRNLMIELDKQAQLGGAAAANLALLHSIKLQQESIARHTQELAELMRQVYGITVYGPDDIANQL